MRGPGKGKSNNPAGKPKGTQNKTTKEMREMILNICEGHISKVNTELKKLEGKEFIDAMSKLFGLVLPKQAEIEGKGNVVFRVEWDDGNDTPEDSQASQ